MQYADHIPAYGKHKATGRAVVRLNGRDVYLGQHGTAASKAEYNRLIAEWLAGGRVMPSSGDITINELLVQYWKHLVDYYRPPSTEPANTRPVMAIVRKMYGHALAKDFGPLALKAVRKTMVDGGLTRGSINHRVNRIRRMFKWAVENELIGAASLDGLKAVSGLRAGHTDAKEADRVKPVAVENVEAIYPHVSRQVKAMIELQLLTGMRSGEVTIMRAVDIDTTGALWIYKPARHKTAHHGHERVVALGPKSQAIVKDFLKMDPSAYLFSPTDAEQERRAKRHAERKTPASCGNNVGTSRVTRRLKTIGDRYTPDSYRQAIEYAQAKAGVPHWHPHQLRHSAATILRKRFGLEAARIVLGHRSSAVTEVYAEVDQGKALAIMAEVG